MTRGLHVGFGARSREHVHAFWRAGLEAGHRDDGARGRGRSTATTTTAVPLDPDGNSAEAVHHGDCARRAHRPPLDPRRRRRRRPAFYELIAPYGGYQLRNEGSDHAHFVGAGGSFSLVAGTPTEHVHLAFPAAENATVDAFHRAAIDAGYRDNGAPGERPRYHPGYYGAYVLDPAGNNVEVVNHNR